MNGNTFALFEGAARPAEQRPFLLVEGETLLTFGGMLTETARAAAWLRDSGVSVGNRVLVQVEKSPASIILYLACLHAGAVFVPLNTAYQKDEVQYFLSDADPDACRWSGACRREGRVRTCSSHPLRRHQRCSMA